MVIYLHYSLQTLLEHLLTVKLLISAFFDDEFRHFIGGEKREMYEWNEFLQTSSLGSLRGLICKSQQSGESCKHCLYNSWFQEIWQCSTVIQMEAERVLSSFVVVVVFVVYENTKEEEGKMFLIFFFTELSESGRLKRGPK